MQKEQFALQDYMLSVRESACDVTWNTSRHVAILGETTYMWF